MTSRDWCFTSFNLDVQKNFEALPDKEAICKFMTCQTEVCPETDREHIQGFIIFKQPVRMSLVKKTLGDQALHCEKRKGTPQQVKPYYMLRHAELPAKNLCPCCPHFLNPYNTGS